MIPTAKIANDGIDLLPQNTPLCQSQESRNFIEESSSSNSASTLNFRLLMNSHSSSAEKDKDQQPCIITVSLEQEEESDKSEKILSKTDFNVEYLIEEQVRLNTNFDRPIQLSNDKIDSSSESSSLIEEYYQPQFDLEFFNFGKLQQESFLLMEEKQKVEFGSSHVNHGTEVFMVDSVWMKMFKNAYFSQASESIDKANYGIKLSKSDAITKEVRYINEFNLQLKKLAKKLPFLTNERIVHDQKQLCKRESLLSCNDKMCQFNHKIKEGLSIGDDFEPVNIDQWKILVKYFSFTEVTKQKKANNQSEQLNNIKAKPIIPLVRSFEKIGLGIRTQIEYFYPKYKVTFVTACPKQLQPQSNFAKLKGLNFGLFTAPNSGVHNTKLKDIKSQNFRYYSPTMTIYFSCKRPIDRLKAHIITVLQEDLQESKINQKRIRIWSTNENSFQKVIKKLDNLKQTAENEMSLNGHYDQISQTNLSSTCHNTSNQQVPESPEIDPSTSQEKLNYENLKGTVILNKKCSSLDQQKWLCLENLGHLFLDQVLYDNLRSSLVVEISPPAEEIFLFKDTINNSQIRTNVVQKLQGEAKENQQLTNQKLVIISKCNYCQTQGQLSYNCQCLKVFYCSQECQIADNAFHEERCQGLEFIEKWDQSCQPNINARMGLTGIRNLNNSCYLSSSLQCLSSMIGLTNYFLSGKFKNEINQHNPLGTQGKLVIGYAKLIKQLWFDDKESIAPSQLKSIIAQFKKQFNNQEQQDSQELLSVLLDGLHEDLNRVKNKPLVPVMEFEGNNDVEASRESWKNHLKRNQSVIVDLMHGLYKSTVRCPDCNRLSVTFEPYMNITLPIPEVKLISKKFFWIPCDTSKRNVLYKFSIKSHLQIRSLKEFISNTFKVNKYAFDLVLIEDDQFLRILPKYELMTVLNHPSLQKATIFAFETNPKALRKKFRIQGKKKLPAEIRELSSTSGFKETEYIIQNDGITIVNQNAQPQQNRQLLLHNNGAMGDNFVKGTTPQSFKQSSSSSSSSSCEQQNQIRNDVLTTTPNVSDNFLRAVKKRAKRGQGFHQKLKPKMLQVIINIQLVKDLEKQEKLELDNNNEVIFGNNDHKEIYETFFPRLAYLNLDKSLIQAHLDIFKMMRPMFLKFLESRERLRNCDEKDYKAMYKRKSVQVPTLLTSQKWKNMSLSEQYETVFGPIDPSRKKLRELPYFVKIVSRHRAIVEENLSQLGQSTNGCQRTASMQQQCDQFEMPAPRISQNSGQGNVSVIYRCVYCKRENCKGCPLRFDDKVTLRQVLGKAGVSTDPSYFYEENRQIKNQDRQNGVQSVQLNKEKRNSNTSKSGGKKQRRRQSENTEQLENSQSDNFEFEILVQFNEKKCWALFNCLSRFVHFQDSEYDSSGRTQNKDKETIEEKTIENQTPDGVSIYDCLRQFNRPEKLSQANAWYCNRCVAHKQAVKKIQVYNVPPVLIINLKRFRGTSTKQDTLVNFPVNGLDMSEFVVSKEKLQNLKPVYDLFAVSNHFGTLQAGHYTAMSLNRKQWYQFNDHKVRACTDEDQIVSSAAYILFYARRGIDFSNLDYDRIKNKIPFSEYVQSPVKEVEQKGSQEIVIDIEEQDDNVLQ